MTTMMIILLLWRKFFEGFNFRGMIMYKCGANLGTKKFIPLYV